MKKITKNLFGKPIAVKTMVETPSILPRKKGSEPAPVAVARRGRIIPDYERHGVDVFCRCDGKGKRFHNFNVRCALCLHCGRRVKGIWFNEHESECWEKKRKEATNDRS